MAQVGLSDLSGALNILIEDRVAKTINRTAPFISGLQVISTGAFVKWAAQVGDSTSQTYLGKSSAYGTAEHDALATASLPVARVATQFSLTHEALSAAAAAAGPDELMNAVKWESDAAVDKLLTIIDTKCLLGDGYGANAIHSFGLAGGSGADDAGGYAGINRSTYPNWAGTTQANTGTPRNLTADIIQRAFQAQKSRGGRPLKVHLDGYQEWMLSQSAGVNNFNRDPLAPGLTLNAGFSQLNVGGVPVMFNPNMPVGKAYVQSEEVFLRYMPVRLPGSMDIMTPIGLPISMQVLPDDGSGFKVGLECYVQLQVKNPAHQVVIGDLVVA